MCGLMDKHGKKLVPAMAVSAKVNDHINFIKTTEDALAWQCLNGSDKGILREGWQERIVQQPKPVHLQSGQSGS